MWECYVYLCRAPTRFFPASSAETGPWSLSLLLLSFFSLQTHFSRNFVNKPMNWSSKNSDSASGRYSESYQAFFLKKYRFPKNLIKLDWNLPDTSFYGDFLVPIVLKIELDLTKTCERHEIMFWIAKNAAFLNTSLIAKNNKFRHFQVKFPPFKAKTRFENAETRFENSKTRYFTLIIRVDYSRMVLKKAFI